MKARRNGKRDGHHNITSIADTLNLTWPSKCIQNPSILTPLLLPLSYHLVPAISISGLCFCSRLTALPASPFFPLLSRTVSAKARLLKCGFLSHLEWKPISLWCPISFLFPVTLMLLFLDHTRYVFAAGYLYLLLSLPGTPQFHVTWSCTNLGSLLNCHCLSEAFPVILSNSVALLPPISISAIYCINLSCSL